MVSVEFREVKKSFGGAIAVDGISLEIGRGELFFLLGPSGCGKTTCLRMTAGFTHPDSGSVLFDGGEMSGVPPHRRNVGMVFQTYALFPHLTVEQNIGYGLRFRKMTPEEKKKRTGEIIERTRLEGLGKRLPAQLSGGQQQRVALARALVIQPDVLLLDEPLSNLDTRLRVEVREEIRRIHREFRITTLYVTHDQEEALSLADRMAVMKDGKIAQIGPPEEVYSRPKNAFVAGFVGETNILEARIEERNGCPGLLTSLGWISKESAAGISGKTVQVSIRPEAVRLVPPGPEIAVGKIESVSFFGSTAKLVVVLPGELRISVMCVAGADGWKEGGAAGIAPEVENVVILE